MISKFGIDFLPVGRGEVRPVELPSVDDRTQVPKEHDSDMKEAGTVQGADTDEIPCRAPDGGFPLKSVSQSAFGEICYH